MCVLSHRFCVDVTVVVKIDQVKEEMFRFVDDRMPYALLTYVNI